MMTRRMNTDIKYKIANETIMKIRRYLPEKRIQTYRPVIAESYKANIHEYKYASNKEKIKFGK